MLDLLFVSFNPQPISVNYYARNDPLVKLDRRAAELMKRLTTDSDFEAVSFCRHHVGCATGLVSLPFFVDLAV